VPTLVLHAGADRLVPPEASEPLGRLPDVTRIVYPGFFHEIHNEPGWQRVVDDIVAWIKQRAGGPGGLAGA
jgi:acylglycerol lipase